MHPGFFYYYPYDPGPPPPKGPADLSFELLSAILKRDLKAARQVFDTAFWEKIPFTPDFYHLLQAVNTGERAMVQLITSYGATWNEAEAKAARLLLKEKIDDVEGVLKAAGIKTQFTPEELAKPDPMVMVKISQRGAMEARMRDQKDAPQAEERLQTVLGLALVHAAATDDRDMLDDVLRRRPEHLGDGTQKKPLNITREMTQLLRDNPGNDAPALAFLDRLKEMDVHIQPMIAGGEVAKARPALIPALMEREVLAVGSMEDRAAMLGTWMTLGEKEAEKKGQLAKVANILFRPSDPATAAEAGQFVKLHILSMLTAPEQAQEAEKVLLKRGFFDSPHFTAQHFKDILAAAPTDATLAEAFNKRAAAKAIDETGFQKFLNDKRFAELVAAHEAGAWKANPEQTVKIVKYLSGKVRKDVVPDEVIAQLKSLKKGGANFCCVKPHEYLGKRTPGFAKTLLDTGAVTAKQFDLDLVSRKIGRTLTLLTPKTDPHCDYTDFACQLLLERIDPAAYMKLRDDPARDYQRAMVKAYIHDPAIRRFLGKSSGQHPHPPHP
jgi:hypothetical protein